MLKIVPDQDASAKSSMDKFQEMFREEVNARVENGDFAAREEVALALANELVRGTNGSTEKDRAEARYGGGAG